MGLAEMRVLLFHLYRYAQNNAIYNITEFEEKAFPNPDRTYEKKFSDYIPFSTYPNLDSL